jgi:rare lipoprotein A
MYSTQLKVIATYTIVGILLAMPINVLASKPTFTAKIKHVVAFHSQVHHHVSANKSKPVIKLGKSHRPKINNTGVASWYGYESGPSYRRNPKTANGESFNPAKLTAAHKTLPFGTRVKVTNLDNNKSVVVVINDRGPFNSRIIDLSKAAAIQIGTSGLARVSLSIL